MARRGRAPDSVAQRARRVERDRTAAGTAGQGRGAAAFTFVTLGLRPALAALSPHDAGWNAWPATIVAAAAATAAWLICCLRCSQRPGWSEHHTLAAAAGYLLAVSTIAFGVDPLGDVPLATKLAVNSTLLAVVVALVAIAARSRQPATAPPVETEAPPSTQATTVVTQADGGRHARRTSSPDRDAQ